jgi:hypothetical protein
MPRSQSALAVKEYVSASTQNQALCSCSFCTVCTARSRAGYWLARWHRACRAAVAFTRCSDSTRSENVAGYASGQQLDDGHRALWCWPSSPRVSSDPSEGYRFDTNPIVVREGRGHKDRLTRLPAMVKAPLLSHLERVRTQYQQDLERGFGRVYLPDARRRKYPTIEREWGWQWAFPASRVSLDPRSGGQRRHHVDESVLQRAIKEAARRGGMVCP